MSYVGIARVPLSSNLAADQTMSWPRLLQEQELAAYGRGAADAAADWEVASASSDREVEAPEWDSRAYWAGFYAGLEDGEKRGRDLASRYLAEGLVDGCKIGMGVDPQTNEPYENLFKSRAGEPRDGNDRRYLCGYAAGLAGRTPEAVDDRYVSGHRDGLARRVQFLGDRERTTEGGGQDG